MKNISQILLMLLVNLSYSCNSNAQSKSIQNIEKTSINTQMKVLGDQMEVLGNEMEIYGKDMEKIGNLKNKSDEFSKEDEINMEMASKKMESKGKEMEVLGKQLEAQHKKAYKWLFNELVKDKIIPKIGGEIRFVLDKDIFKINSTLLSKELHDKYLSEMAKILDFKVTEKTYFYFNGEIYEDFDGSIRMQGNQNNNY